MATKDSKSRLEGGNLNSPAHTSPNGVTEHRGSMGATAADTTASRSDVGRREDVTPGEKIGRFFRKAMERLSGRDEEAWRRESDRNRRDRETQEPYRAGDRSSQSGRSPPRERGQSGWSDLDRSRDDRGPSYRGGPSGNTGGSDARLRTGSGSAHVKSGSAGQGGYERDETLGQGPSFENRSGQSLGPRGLGRSPSESYGLAEFPGEQPIGSDRGFVGDQGGQDWNRGDWSRSHPYRDRWAAERSAQSGATGMSTGYGSSGASFGFGRDEDRLGDWGEIARDRDRGQGRRFWQREPLAARDVMTRNPRTVTRQSAHREAATIMRDENCGVVPVVDAAGRLEGILTDRDIVVRGVAHDRALDLRIEDVMTDDVSAVTEDEPLTSVLDLMGRRQIRRVPVVDRDDRLLGIISMADIANRADYDEDLQDAFERISSRRSFWSLFS